MYALEQVRRKGYLPQADKIEHVEPFDRLVLTAIDHLRGRGDTAKIIAKAEKLSRTRVLPSSVLAAIATLEKRGLIWSRLGRRTTGPHGKRTQYFTITLAGGRSLGNWHPLKPLRQRSATRRAESDWDDVLQDLNEENPVIDYDTLVQWCNRYPKHRVRLADHFVSEAVVDIQQGERQHLIDVTDEELLSGSFESRDADYYAPGLLRAQGRPIPPPPIKTLEPFDRHVLKAVYKVRGNAHVGKINDEVSRLSRTRVLPASTSASLHRLEKLGLVVTFASGGQRYFKITAGSKTVLAK